MATKKISQLEAITEAENSDVLVIVDVSEGTTNKITKNNLLKGTGHTIEMSLNENYQIVLKLKNAEGTELSTDTIDLPNENAITNISYSNGTLTLTKQSGVTSTVDISGLINGLATETALTNLANALKETIGIDTTTYNESQTYNTGDIVIQNEKIYKANQDNITGTFDSSKWDEISLYEYQKLQDEQIAENYKEITKLQEDVEDLTERMEDAENNEMTNTPEVATSHYLQDSAGSRFRKFIPIGRTTQDSTTGKQLFDYSKVKNISDLASGSYLEKYNNGVLVKGNQDEQYGFASYGLGWYSPGSAASSAEAKITVEEETTLYISVDVTLKELYKSDFNRMNIYLYGTNQYTGNLYTTLTLNEKKRLARQITVQPGTYYPVFTLSGNTFLIENIMISTSEDTSYEPYTGGEPAPNPIYPYAIKNTGDNGPVNEKVQNFNIWDEEWEVGGINSSNGENFVSTSIIRSKNYISVQPNTQYYIKNSTDYAWFYAYDKDKNFIGYAFGSSSSVANEIKTTFSNCYYLRFQCRSQYGTTYKNDICINVSNPSINGTYIPHAEQKISFPLAQGQKLYQDEELKENGKDDIWSEYIFTGEENWTLYSETETVLKAYSTDPKLGRTNNMERTEDAFCTHFKNNTFYSSTNGIGLTQNATYVSVSKTIASNVSELKSLFATQYTNETPVKVQYKKKNPTTTSYTEEQQTAWEQIKKARTYKNITHISSEDETPANVEIEYVVDINTIDDRITALEAKVDLLEE